MSKNQIRTAFINYVFNQFNSAITRRASRETVVGLTDEFPTDELFGLCRYILTETCDFMGSALVEIIPGGDDQMWQIDDFVWQWGDDSSDYTPEYEALENYAINQALAICKVYGYNGLKAPY